MFLEKVILKNNLYKIHFINAMPNTYLLNKINNKYSTEYGVKSH